ACNCVPAPTITVSTPFQVVTTGAVGGAPNEICQLGLTGCPSSPSATRLPSSAAATIISPGPLGRCAKASCTTPLVDTLAGNPASGVLGSATCHAQTCPSSVPQTSS